ncbi:MAG: SMI1/KNR4 family protein [Gemmataceae bacterium]
MLDAVAKLFPRFAELAPERELENVAAPATDAELRTLEADLGLPLPESYKALLRCAREFWLLGGVVKFAARHPFVHHFHPFSRLSEAQQRMVTIQGGKWPPPSEGMLCFAECSLEADGDQVLFDVRNGLVNGEYPVVYYAHEQWPPSVRQLAPTFAAFMDGFLDYEEFKQ